MSYVPSLSSAGHTRRPWLRLLLAVTVVATFLVGAPSARRASADTPGPNPVVVENQQQGTSDWKIDGTPADDVRQQAKGYASATSVNLGGPITFFVSVNPSQAFSLDIFRTGYYQGLGGRLMQHVGNLSGIKQQTCPTDSSTGMISCAWQAAYSMNVPTNWTSGVYLVKITNSKGYQNYIPFVVRDDARKAALLYQQSVTTYQAYNNYPNDIPAGGTLPATGKSLYDFNSSTTKTGLGTARAAKVSFDRPYSKDDGAGQYFDFESHYVRWIEQNGYDVSYSTDVDTHENGAQLLNYAGFLSIGHDEYWTKAMFDNVAAARDHGVSVGFFGGNEVYWQARFEPSAGGQADRVLTCYKDANLDPVKDTTTTMRWRDPQVNRPEQQLIGLTGVGQQADADPPANYIATNTSHWVYAGTGVSDNTPVGKVVGYETDRYVNGYTAPTAAAGTYTMLSSSPYTTTNGTTEYQQSSIYQAPSGAWVFGAGTIDWSWGLSNDDSASYADPRIQQMTANVLNRFVAGSQPLSPAASNLTSVPVSGGTNLTWTDNATDETGYVLDRSTSPTFDTATSIPLPPDTTSYADTGLAAGTYYYRLRTVNANGSSPWVMTSASTIPYAQLVDGRHDLLAHWRLGDNSTTAWDTTGTYNGAYSSGTHTGDPGAIARDPDTAVTFNGTPQAKVTPAALPSATNFTVEGWSYLTAASPMNNTVYGGSSSVRILARPGAPNSPTAAYAGVWLNGTEYVLQPSTSVSNLNQWVQWALTRDGSTLTLYRNGVLIGQRVDLPATATADLSGNIGTQANGGAYPLNGRIDEVAVYNGVRSGGDIADDYTAGVNGPTAPPPPTPSTSYRDTVLGETGLMSYWRLGEASGTTAADSKGTANGTYVNGVTRGVPGAVTNDPNTAAGFNGTNQRVTVPALAPVGDFSIEGWTYLTNASSSNNNLYGANLDVRILARPGNASSPTAAYAGVWLNGTEYVLQPTSPAPNINTWVHWVLTRQGGTLTLYRNGAQIGQRTDLPATATANVSGAIGAQQGSAYFLAGNVDDVAVYNAALTPTAVSAHYRAALSGPGPQ